MGQVQALAPSCRPSARVCTCRPAEPSATRPSRWYVDCLAVGMRSALTVSSLILSATLAFCAGCSDEGPPGGTGSDGGGAESSTSTSGAPSGTPSSSGTAGAGASGTGGAAASGSGAGAGGGAGGGELVFFDDFEYDVGREDPDAGTVFLAAGYGWAKTEQDTGAHQGGAGYLYTVSSVPGFSGTFPGAGSRVLALEARPNMYPPPENFPYTQTDFYLQIGSESNPEATIPANLWIQFWVYINDSGDQQSEFPTRSKFFYPSASEPLYPSSDERWLFMNGRSCFEAEAGGISDNYLCMRPPAADFVASEDYPTNANKLGQNLSSKQILANGWYLVRLHVDTSAPQGSWEAWLRGQNEPAMTKIAEWIGGVTPSFSWPLPPEQQTNLRAIRIPTTVNEFDSWMYMDDLAIATSESALPAP
jgi:hypothetical protein